MAAAAELELFLPAGVYPGLCQALMGYSIPNIVLSLITKVLVDIPGLLEGAHQGVGLGLTFLRYRTTRRRYYCAVFERIDDLYCNHRTLSGM